MISRVLIMFKMEDFNEGGETHISKMIYPPKNKAKGYYEDYEDHGECILKKILGLLRSLVKS